MKFETDGAWLNISNTRQQQRGQHFAIRQPPVNPRTHLFQQSLARRPSSKRTRGSMSGPNRTMAGSSCASAAATRGNRERNPNSPRPSTAAVAVEAFRNRLRVVKRIGKIRQKEYGSSGWCTQVRFRHGSRAGQLPGLKPLWPGACYFRIRQGGLDVSPSGRVRS